MTSSTRARNVRALTATGATALAALLVGASTPADAAPNNNSSQKLRKAVTAAGLLEHEAAFQAIADAHDDNRASGTSGYDASAAYVIEQLEGTGFEVTTQEFTFDLFAEEAPTTFARTSPDPRTYSADEFAIMEYSGSGEVTDAPVVPVDVVLPPGASANTSTSGCESSDFAGFPAGAVALLQRGTCTFALKAENAEAAGASAVVVFNEGQDGRTATVNGTLGGESAQIPVIGTTFAVGQELAELVQPHVSISALTSVTEVTTSNVIAEKAGRDEGNVVMAGAHLDSVLEGPGINDNGSGSSALLEIAQQLAKTKPVNTLRFAWWGAEESGLIGSYEYVDSLSEEEVQDIALYLNFDMVGSPNYARFVYDGDGDAFGTAGPEGSDAIEALFADFFETQGLASAPTEFSGRSDYAGFIDVGIPSGGLFTGAEGIKTDAEAALFGGLAGEAYDPCYHQACDTLTVQDQVHDDLESTGYDLVGNVNVDALEEMSDAMAHAIITYAYSTQSVNGERGNPGRGHSRVSGPGGGETGEGSADGGHVHHEAHLATS